MGRYSVQNNRLQSIIEKRRARSEPKDEKNEAKTIKSTEKRNYSPHSLTNSSKCQSRMSFQGNVSSLMDSMQK